MSKNWLALAITLGTGLSAVAGPVQRENLPAAPAWAFHLDCDALRVTGLGQYLLAEAEKPEPAAKLAAFHSIFGFDPRRQLHGLTVYSTSSPEDGVLLVNADFDSERLITLAKAAKDHQSTNHNGHVIHNWVDDNKKAKGGLQPRTFAAIHGGKIILFSQREAPIAAALDVLDGQTPSLASSKIWPLFGGTGDSSVFIQGAAGKLDLPASLPNSDVFRLASGASLLVSELNRQVNAKLTVETKSEEIATNMALVAKGLLALTKLQTGRPESVKFAEALTVAPQGSRVTAHATLPIADVIAMIKADAARKARKQAESE